ncbi:MAG: hypothetical protein JW708_05880 [Vallitaleaceae bacterium]|jgi:DNA mismatch repair protein MutS|nr:hypothetical protein [Vallitaleaceae bacterium]
MNFNSILWLTDSQKSRIDRKVIEDLNLKEVYQRLLLNDEILFTLCMDLETIRYRQEIFSDFFDNEGLLKDLTEVLKAFYDLKPLYRSEQYKDSNLYRLIDILIVMEKSMICLDEIRQILGYYSLNSEGLRQLLHRIEEYLKTAEYKKMKEDLKEIKHLFKGIRSATLSVSMSSAMRPVFAQVTSIDDYKHRYPKAFRKVSDVLKEDPIFLKQRLTSYVPVFRVGRLNYDLLEEIEFSLRKNKPLITRFVDTYEKVDLQPFIQLMNEITFYESGFQLFMAMKKADLPFSKPEFIEKKQCFMHLEQLYNINLAIGKIEGSVQEEIIKNDFVFDDSKSYYIITGANRGGKTTFTQAIGQIQLLAQFGMYVPCERARVGIVDKIVTVFPVMEAENVDKGKFGRECEMFVEGFHKATAKTLFLMNEAFAGTSHLESLNIATEGMKALIYRNIPFIFNTHLHELVEEIRKSFQGEEEKRDEYCDKIISLVTKMKDTESSYIMEEREPLGKSYAIEIARKYRITYEDLLKSGV